MRRLRRALFTTLALAGVMSTGLVAPVGAAEVTAEPQVRVITRVCNRYNTCLEMDHNGYYVYGVRASGIATSRSCVIYGRLVINGIRYGRSNNVCAIRGDLVYARFNINARAARGDKFTVIWNGAGRPVGPYPALAFT